MADKICVALVWHMHQPEYRDPETGISTLPWVRLHAAKDYVDMAALAAEFPRVKQVFNLTPVLLSQIEDMKAGGHELFLDVALKPVAELNASEKLFILKNYFMLNWDRHVEPRDRFRDLLERRGRGGPETVGKEALSRFNESDIRDLITLYNLCWIDPHWIERDPGLRELAGKKSGFTEEEKNRVLAKHAEILADVIPMYRKLADDGVIEITTSPFYHPIAPLLLDNAAALESRPETILPVTRFDGRRDVEWQVDEALALMRRLFGRAPEGMWPSEGSISQAFMPVAAEKGIRWMASDEEVLRLSLYKSGRQPIGGDHYRAYRHTTHNTSVNLIFRDHLLSDLIGFVYSRWPAEDAAMDMVEKIKKAGREAGNADAPPLVSIILDGENPWENYANDGRDFLRAVYRRLSEDPEIECVLVSDYLRRYPPQTELPSIFAGSWINHDFSIWIGHEEDRTAWEYVAETREVLLAREDSLPPEVFKHAWRHLMTAEGSDWTWWYGVEHFSLVAKEFDRLFRSQLAHIHRLIGAELPNKFLIPIKKDTVTTFMTAPRDFLSITLDGKVTNYYEWISAGMISVSRATSEMHRSWSIVQQIHYGAAKDGSLAFRLDIDPHQRIIGNTQVVIRLLAPTKGDCILEPGDNGWAARFEPVSGSTANVVVDGRFGTIFEGIIRFGPGTPVTGEYMFIVMIREIGSDRILEQWPTSDAIAFKLPAGGDFSADWVV
jgi:alpha-amylase/alpha-mannosidase (GH57 family)